MTEENTSLPDNKDEIEGYLKTALEAHNAIPEGERAYYARFVSKNAHLGEEEMLRRFWLDVEDRRKGREEQAVRDEKTIQNWEEFAKRNPDAAVAVIKGIGLDGTTGKPTAEGNATAKL